MTSAETEQIDFSKYWQESGIGIKPNSTTLNPEFINILKSINPGTYLDVGCGTGQLKIALPHHHSLIGIDQDESAIEEAQAQNYDNAKFAVASAENILFPDNTFDGTFLMGILGSVNQETRAQITNEAIRVTKPEGTIYIAEFAVITDPQIRTSFGKKWVDVYRDDEPKTGEAGTVIVLNPDQTPKFLAHHFTDDELIKIAKNSGIGEIEIRKVQITSSVSGLKRDNWNLWGNKLMPI